MHSLWEVSKWNEHNPGWKKMKVEKIEDGCFGMIFVVL